jgi:large subunit ribosomal protein L11
MGEKVSAMVEGGKATPGPPLGPALGPHGVNIPQIVKAINEKTKDYDGMRVPVVIEINPDKTFNVSVGTPPVSALVLKELGAEKGGNRVHADKGLDTKHGGDLKFDQVLKIAKMKHSAGSIRAAALKGAVKEVLGTCVSMGVTCDGKSAKDVQSAIDKGQYDAKMK